MPSAAWRIRSEANQMARADLILNLVKAGAQGDQARFQRTVEALAADERSKKHTILADRLLAQLRTSENGRYICHQLPPSSNSLSGPLVAEIAPERRIEDLLLPDQCHRGHTGLGGRTASS